MKHGRWSSLAVVLSVVSWSARSLAGPPYTTDDPEPVEYQHWELYLASATSHDRGGWIGTAPHWEVNYGAVPNVQLHLIAPLAYSVPDGGRSAYGFGDVELGIKYRFVGEQKWVPQMGTFPLLEVPTGSRGSGLGNGTAQVFLPLWLQKSMGQWTTYGGAGFWIDTGQDSRHWWYFGWQVQRQLFPGFALGAEVFHLTPREPGTERDTRFNLGAVVDFSDQHHVLLSAGRGFAGPNRFQAYVAYQATLGPPDRSR
jgi:hypothetical protein